jgi:hypothetical protein
MSALALAASGAASAGGFDFNSTPTGTYSSLTDGTATITFTGGTGKFDVADASPGWPIDGRAIISYFANPGSDPFKVTFAGGASMFKIGVGDYDADEDHTHLRAWSASDVLLASADYDNPAPNYGGDYMMVSSATPIAYVTFWDGEPYPGAVYWDNITYTPAVPEPETYALMALGLAAVGFVARRRRQA